jgi:hypothetical protein
MKVMRSVAEHARAARMMLEAAVLSIAAGGGLCAAVLLNPLLPF